MDKFWDKLDLFLFGERDDGTVYVSSSEPMIDPYTHKPAWVATLTRGGKTYSVELKEIDS